MSLSSAETDTNAKKVFSVIMNSTTYESTGCRFVAVLNKKYEIGRLMNAIGHLPRSWSEDLDKLAIENYFDLDGGLHANISDHPSIILKADNSNKIRTLKQSLLDQKIDFTDFTDTIVSGSAQEQRQNTAKTSEADSDYIGLCFFAPNKTSKELTKKFSIFN